MDTRKTTKNADSYRIKIYRSAMRGWHCISAYAEITVLGTYATAVIDETENGWSASVNFDGFEYRAGGRRQMDAATSLCEMIVATMNAKASRIA
jgi:hypothetical protein